MKHNTNGDHAATGFDGPDFRSDGLTKREHFAAMALQGLLASDVRDNPEGFATYSVKAADALIKELNKTKETNE